MPHYQTGLFIGRFQPFHLGHLSALKQGMEIADRIILVVGSANQNFSLKNPLTIDERLELIKTVLHQEQLDQRLQATKTMNDVPNNLQWADKLIQQVPPFKVVIGNNNLNDLLFEYRGFKLFHPKLTQRERYQGEVIRQKVIEGKPWQQFVPAPTLPLLEKFQFEKRLQVLNQKGD